MPTYLEIAVNVPQVMGVFHYHLPPELEELVSAGHLVEVPFGKQVVQGVVLGTVPIPSVPETKPVLRLIDPDCVLTEPQLLLAKKIAENTLAPLAACIDLMLPPGLGQHSDTLYTIRHLSSTLSDQAEDLKKPQPGRRDIGLATARASREQTRTFTDLEKRLLTLLDKRGPLRGRQIEQSIRHVNWKPVMQGLVRGGYVSVQSVLPPPAVRPKQVRTAQLALPPEEAEARLLEVTRPDSLALKRRQAILRFLTGQPGPVDVAWVYADSGGKLDDLHKLAELGLISFGESETWRDPLAQVDFIPTEAPPLTIDQEKAFLVINQGIQAAAAGEQVAPYLLHGVTGSGKTEIYLRAVKEAIDIGKQVIILVPEIALTPQTIHRFLSRFPGRVGLMHSGLSPGERYDTWRRARNGQLSIIVGPRSALFVPFPRLGLIVVDEFHDDSYYQSETLPYYHASSVAIYYAPLAGAVCLLGSATPDINSRYRADQEHWHYLRLPSRILGHHQVIQTQAERLGITSHYHLLSDQTETIDLPPVRVVDMRQELKAGNRSIFSRPLQAALSEVLSQGQQAILFLNRRGSATYIFCRDCGYTLKCPRCELPLTYHIRHSASQIPEVGDIPTSQPPNLPILLCHHCGYQRKMPTTCPACGGTRIRQYGTGTESVESEIQTLFPEARTLRWDYETTRQKGSHDLILNHFVNHRADILIGTQMIAKGLDLPLVTLVGMVLADVGLSLPDYRAPERTFHLLTQVAGRAGRSLLGGQVVLQTFQPDHYVVQTAAQHDYQAFYEKEIEYRRQLGYPPFSRLVRLEYRHQEFLKAEASAKELDTRLHAQIIDDDHRATEIIGPTPCFFSRLGGLYRWQVILRGPDPASVLRGLNLVDWRVEVDPVSLL